MARVLVPELPSATPRDIVRKLDEKQHNQDVNQWSDVGCWHHKRRFYGWQHITSPQLHFFKNKEFDFTGFTF